MKKILTTLLLMLFVSSFNINNINAKTRKKGSKAQTSFTNFSANISGIIGLDEPWTLILKGVKGTLKSRGISYNVKIDSFLGNFLELSYFNQKGEKVGKIYGVVEFQSKVVRGIKVTIITWYDGDIFTFFSANIDDGYSTRFTFGTKKKSSKLNKPNKEHVVPASNFSDLNELMRAPSVIPNKDGFINRENAPQSNANVKAEPNILEDDNNVSIKFYVKGKLTQTLKSYYNFTHKGFYVFYLDFNYDSYTDIYVIAKEVPYGGSHLFLWNPDLKKFEESNASAQYFSLLPSNKTINFYHHSLALMGENHYEKCVFKNNKYEVIDEITELPNEDGSHSYYYMGLGSFDNTDFSEESNNPKGLSYSAVPQEWREIMRSFGRIL